MKGEFHSQSKDFSDISLMLFISGIDLNVGQIQVSVNDERVKRRLDVFYFT